MSEREVLAEQICATGRWLQTHGFVAATEGNLSCRLSDSEVLCTPSTVYKGDLTPRDLCVVDLAGEQLSGDLPRTSEILLHLEIYQNNPETGAVVHAHPPHATAFAISAEPLPSGLLAEVEYFLQDIPMIDYRTPGTAELAELIAPHAKTSRCAILKNHGAISWDRNIERARWWMETLEAYCRVVILAKSLGEFAALSRQDIATLRSLARRDQA